MRFSLAESLFALALLSSAALLPVRAQPASSPSDYEAVRVPLKNYLRARATGNGSYIHDAFFPEARLFFVPQDTLRTLTVSEYASRFSGQPVADEAVPVAELSRADAERRLAEAQAAYDAADKRDIPQLDAATARLQSARARVAAAGAA